METDGWKRVKDLRKGGESHHKQLMEKQVEGRGKRTEEEEGFSSEHEEGDPCLDQSARTALATCQLSCMLSPIMNKTKD